MQKLRIKQRISNALSKIHVSYDTWTSPNNLLILGVIGHFVSSEKKLERCVLAIKELHGEHTGVSMASQVLDVIVDWGFEKRLGYFQADNVLINNDSLCQGLKVGEFSLYYYTLHKLYITYMFNTDYIYSFKHAVISIRT